MRRYRGAGNEPLVKTILRPSERTDTSRAGTFSEEVGD
jgi:hypothetical protein